MPSQYSLEVYDPGRTDVVLMNFESDAPFQTIQRGDLVNPYPSGDGTTILQVSQVEHILWEADGRPKHKLCVFTKEVKNTREIRMGD